MLTINDYIQKSKTPKTVVIAMSGGVDSAVAAAILKEQGHNVIGITLQIWQESTKKTKGAGCCSLGAVEDARRVANKIGIPHYVLNYSETFADNVIKPFIEDYKNGRTPNPCINCNKYIKFDSLLQKTLQLGADYLATGHYANVHHHIGENNRHIIQKAENGAKDQTYALYATKQNQLQHMIMPLGELPTKEITRQIAREIGLTVANKPDSQEICFVQNNDYTDYLKKRAPEIFEEGKFIDTSGKTRGKHDGIANFTIGQRKRINVGSSIPLYVINIDPMTNTVILGAENDLYRKGLIVEDLNWVSINPPNNTIPCEVKIRYNSKPTKATIKLINNKVEVVFDEPQKSITPGQASVFYGINEKADYVLGGGTIKEAI
jgi:tRNA-specific 2-thiouridylase